MVGVISRSLSSEVVLVNELTEETESGEAAVGPSSVTGGWNTSTEYLEYTFNLITD